MVTNFLDVANIAGKVIDKVSDYFPSIEAKNKAKVKILELQQNGDLHEIESAMQIIIQEAQSEDKYTSRARPSFMYMFYIIILMAVPVGLLNGFNPEMGVQVADGMKAWWCALPTELWWTFGVGFTGYVTSRSIDKSGLRKMIQKK